jgi:hypothetical protein
MSKRGLGTSQRRSNYASLYEKEEEDPIGFELRWGARKIVQMRLGELAFAVKRNADDRDVRACLATRLSMIAFFFFWICVY